MKIYAIRDRMIDYYMTPFVAPSDKDVLSAISQQVNMGDAKSAIAQAPHHFEIWTLGEVQEDGTLTAHRELIADAAGLVRGDFRPNGANGARAKTPDRAPDESTGEISRNRVPPGTYGSPVPHTPPSGPVQAEEAHRTTDRRN